MKELEIDRDTVLALQTRRLLHFGHVVRMGTEHYHHSVVCIDKQTAPRANQKIQGTLDRQRLGRLCCNGAVKPVFHYPS